MESSAQLQITAYDFEEELATLTVLCERTEFILQASPANLVFPKEEGHTYQQLLKAITTDRVKYRAATEPLRHATLAPFLPTIQTLTTRFEPGRDLTVREFAECNRFQLCLESNNQILVAEQKQGPLARDLVSQPIPNLTLPPTIPLFDASEVTPASYDAAAATEGIFPIKATAAGQARFFKAAMDLRYPEFAHEIATYVALHDENYSNCIPRIPVLEGVVVTSSMFPSKVDTPPITTTTTTGPCILGFLTTWIDGVKLADVSRQDRQSYMASWRATVRETVESLHSRSILWGDVNAHNVVIDREMGAWVVDFGRGGEGLYGRAEVDRFDVEGDGAEGMVGDGGNGNGNGNGFGFGRVNNRAARRRVEMQKELEGVDAMMEALLPLGPEESQWLGPFYLHEG